MIKFNPPTQIECGWEQSTITTSCLFFPSFKKDFEGKNIVPFQRSRQCFFFFSLLVCRAFFRISRVALYVMSALCNAEHQTCRLVLNCYLPFVIDQHHWRKKKSQPKNTQPWEVESCRGSIRRDQTKWQRQRCICRYKRMQFNRNGVSVEAKRTQVPIVTDV